MSSRPNRPSWAHPSRNLGWSRTTADTASCRIDGSCDNAWASPSVAEGNSGSSTVSGGPEVERLTGGSDIGRRLRARLRLEIRRRAVVGTVGVELAVELAVE